MAFLVQLALASAASITWFVFGYHLARLELGVKHFPQDPRMPYLSRLARVSWWIAATLQMGLLGSLIFF